MPPRRAPSGGIGTPSTEERAASRQRVDASPAAPILLPPSPPGSLPAYVPAGIDNAQPPPSSQQLEAAPANDSGSKGIGRGGRGNRGRGGGPSAWNARPIAAGARPTIGKGGGKGTGRGKGLTWTAAALTVSYGVAYKVCQHDFAMRELMWRSTVSQHVSVACRFALRGCSWAAASARGTVAPHSMLTRLCMAPDARCVNFQTLFEPPIFCPLLSTNPSFAFFLHFLLRRTARAEVPRVASSFAAT
jgi:hypothetical protein